MYKVIGKLFEENADGEIQEYTLPSEGLIVKEKEDFAKMCEAENFKYLVRFIEV